MKPRVTLRAALADKNLLGNSLPGPSWSAWRTLLIASMGEPLTDAERVVFTALTGREQEPLRRCEEVAVVAGRRGGKTEAISTVGAYLAGCCDFSDVLVPGEVGVLMIVGADIGQSIIALDRIEAKLKVSPLMRQLVKSRTQYALKLANGISVIVKAPNFRRIRGQTLIGFIGDEIAHWTVDEGAANPDTQIVAAARPALSTTGAPLFLISSPYAKKGELFTLWKRHYGPAGDPLIMVAQAASRILNPTLPQSIVDRAMERDSADARAEYLAEFRSDILQFIDRDVVIACTMAGVRELPPAREISYKCFVDPSGGSSDSFTLCVGHHDGKRDTCVIDALREWQPPFSPEVVVAEIAQLLKSYRVNKVVGDRFGGVWVQEMFLKHAVNYELSAMSKSQLYGSLLPLLNSGRIDLLDNQRLVMQLVGLERRTARSGKDSIDHAQGGHDDLSNVIAGIGAITIASSGYSSEIYRLVTGVGGDTVAEPAPARFANGDARPLWGSQQAGAVPLGNGGYVAPNHWTGGANVAEDVAWEKYKAMMTAPKTEKT